MTSPSVSLAARLEHYSIPEPNSGCLLWLGSIDRKGYGQLRFAGRLQYAHRLSWSADHGPVPVGHGVLHRCDNPACINPAHLFTGTQKTNTDDMMAKGRDDQSGLALGRRAHPNPARGEACARAKLTADQALAIRADHRVYRVIALAYGVSRDCVKAIKTRRTWRHI